ncbi:S8 family peptidase [Lachnoclostridium phytofermentans]|uniref:Peptidase S8 and S53 subtilisin kexin sedolisin n=1 Tax=Lachnoclostridium phytofermentans (strain ATCC 700394 / DSM 18823 / ISDg) TaxID=357809 RepID=A9KQN2_LACP7|nr:S8 family peptidase [Lachnoclostridium phytofermentans]ABX41945.1 peptidase S8 and S53 subtilisin kexin sedolisin [Lachnoclostridium phytofermentans ISDg]
MENKFNSEKFMDLIIPNALLNVVENQGTITNINDSYSIVHIPIDKIDFCNFNGFSYSYFPTCYTLDSTVALEKIGFVKVRNNPNLSLYGAGVLVGVVDSGVNYQHKAFLFKDNTTKINSIWDQTIYNENTPVNEEFPYGTFYSREDINRALALKNPLDAVPSTDENGHGTAIAGIIVGNEDTGNEFSGVAPLSELIVVKLKQAKKVVRQFFAVSQEVTCYQKSDIMMGIKYIINVARRLNRPLVLCIAMGSSQGGDDGLDPLSYYLNDISRAPRSCVVVSGGNEGNRSRHYLGSFGKGDEFKEFEFKVGEKDKAFFMEIWMQPIQRLSFEITSPAGEKISSVYPGIRQIKKYNFIFGPTKLCINNITTEAESGDQLILLRFNNTQSGVWKIRLNNIDRTPSDFNVWLPSGELITNETFFLQSNPYLTITAPGNAFAPITIGAYDTLEGGIATFSSKGYTRKDVIKPDLTAPGTFITSPSNKEGYVTVSGTGSAAALTTGVVALLLEWAILRGNYTGITGSEIKTFLIRGARRELNVDYPNRTWGYGQIDLFGTFEKLTL